MNMPSSSELFFIFMVVLLLFGAKRIPEIAKSFGKAANEFKKAKDEVAGTENNTGVKDETTEDQKK